MALGVIARKRGMTRVYADDGKVTPVTVLEVLPNRVTRVKTLETDGYRAVQVTTGDSHRNRITKPRAGEFAKAGIDAGRGLWEFRLADAEDELTAGAELKADVFVVGQRVDVAGTTVGKGYAGTIKRHHFRSGDATHGNSLAHRAPGSIGQNQAPGKVFKGKKMSGQLGNARCTIQDLEVMRVDIERNLLLVKGAVPGAKGGDVIVRPSLKGGPVVDTAES